MSRRSPFYVRFRGLLIGLGAVAVGMISMAIGLWTGHILAGIVYVLTLPVVAVGFVIHFIDMFRRLRKGPDDVF